MEAPNYIVFYLINLEMCRVICIICYFSPSFRQCLDDELKDKSKTMIEL